MKPTTRRKVKRHLLSALLSGAFSDEELKEVAESLIKEDISIADLGHNLIQIVSQLSHPENDGRTASKREENALYSPAVEEAVQLAKKAGVVQRELLSIIGEIAPETVIFYENKRWKTIRIIDHFLSTQGEMKHQQLVSALRNRVRHTTGDSDPYLDLISKKIKL